MLARIAVLAGLPLALACAGCASPSPQHDADWQPEKIYRTGSNIPTKDYGAANIEIGKPDVGTPMDRPGAGVLGRKPGG
jgi:hypothetical protein